MEAPGVVRATGRRKNAVAVVRMKAGDGRFLINERDARAYLCRDTLMMVVQQPLEAVLSEESFGSQRSFDLSYSDDRDQTAVIVLGFSFGQAVKASTFVFLKKGLGFSGCRKYNPKHR